MLDALLLWPMSLSVFHSGQYVNHVSWTGLPILKGLKLGRTVALEGAILPTPSVEAKVSQAGGFVRVVPGWDAAQGHLQH